jgi:hypothetical protein
MSNIEEEIRAKTEAFAADLAVLVRRVALESVSAVLGGAAAAAPAKVAARRGPGRPKKVAAPAPAPPAAVKRGPGRPKKVVAPAAKAPVAKAAPASKAAVSKKPAAKRPSGAKRPPEELAKLTEKLGEYIKAHPGLRIEPIGKALSVPTKELSLPVKKLLAAKKIRSEGQKRATEYFPG